MRQCLIFFHHTEASWEEGEKEDQEEEGGNQMKCVRGVGRPRLDKNVLRKREKRLKEKYDRLKEKYDALEASLKENMISWDKVVEFLDNSDQLPDDVAAELIMAIISKFS